MLDQLHRGLNKQPSHESLRDDDEEQDKSQEEEAEIVDRGKVGAQ